MKLIELCQAANIRCAVGQEQSEVRAIVTDSRRALPGCMFVCIRGLRQDGHKFVKDAVERGAKWIVAEDEAIDPAGLPATVLWTKDTRRALSCVMDAWNGYPSKKMTFVGVTGTNGKTSVTCMIHHVLQSCGIACGLIGTLGAMTNGKMKSVTSTDPNANMTTPEPEVLYALLADMYASGVRTVAMEVSSHALAQGRVAPLRFRVGVFTNLTPEHLDFHSDMDEYADAKASMFSQCDCAIINADSPYAERMMRSARKYITCSQELLVADCPIEKVVLDALGCTYRLRFGNDEQTVICPVQGVFSVMNSAEAILACERLGVPLSDACDVMKRFKGVRGRMERVSLPESAPFSAIIDYAHTPDALKNLLESIRASNPKGRIVLLFGCGGDRDATKRSVMGRISSALADHVILTSDNSRSESTDSILREIVKGIDFSTPCTIISDRAEAIEYAVKTAKKGDVLVLAGKGHEEYEIGKDGKKPFSEIRAVQSAYQNKIECEERDVLP